MGNEVEVTQELPRRNCSGTSDNSYTQEEGPEARTKVETKTKQLPEENRKRKRSEEETEEEEKVDELILESAHIVMKETMLQKDFIGERGFVKLISPTREVIEK